MPHTPLGVDSITIRGLSGPSVSGTEWVISSGPADLDSADTKRAAIQRAKSLAMPGQEIRVVGTTGRVEIVRKWDESKLPVSQPPGDSIF